MALDRYTHDRREQTSDAMIAFAKSLQKLISLKYGGNCILRLEYETAPYGTESAEVMVFVQRDEDEGFYFLNNVQINTLDDAIQVWSMACANVIKPIASDEKREDDFEELGAEAIPTSLEEILDAYGPSDDKGTHDNDDDRESIVTEFLNSRREKDTLEESEEPTIYEEYHGQTLELKPPRDDDPSDNEGLEDVTDDEQNQHGAEAA
jgi:hypothetical protein